MCYPPNSCVELGRVRGFHREVGLGPAIVGVWEVVPVDEHGLVSLEGGAGELLVQWVAGWEDYVRRIIFTVFIMKLKQFISG